MELRPYQQDVVDAVEAGWAAASKQLIVVPTGGGKTVIFSKLADLHQPRRTLILAHREELLSQAQQKLRAATGIEAEIEKAEFRASWDAPVVVGSVQSMIRRLDNWPADHFDLVVVDEAHHAISDSYQRVLHHFDAKAKVLGVTATPDRGDKRNLGEYFEAIAAEVSLTDLIRDGYLSRISIRSIPIQIDLSRVSTVAGDFSDADLGEALEPYLETVAYHIRMDASFRRCLVFLPLIATSKKFVAACQKFGLAAEHVDGMDPDRAGKLERFARGEYDVLANAMLLTEGFDDPGIDCVVVLRPTRSRSLYCQMVGRGTRIHELKENLLLLDFLWHHERHALIRPAHLIAKSDDEAKEMQQIAEEKSSKGGEPCELELDLGDIATAAQHEREKKLREAIKQHSTRKGGLIDAVEWAIRNGDFDAAEYEPTMKWESKEITPKQLQALKRAKIDPETVSGRGHASKLLSIYFGKKPLTLATPAQRAVLRRAGHPSPDTATDAEAREFFAAMRR